MEHVVWALVRQSDAVSQAVLIILVGMSILCWSIAGYKLLVLYYKSKDIIAAKRLLDKAKSIDEVLIQEKVLKNSPIAPFFNMLNKANSAENFERTIDDLLYQEEEYVSVLKVSAEVAPLIGLFGTVWGLIHSFIRISAQQNADIVTVAPGISEALITTLMGLIVAIPALVLFHQVNGRIKSLEYHLEMSADRLISLIKRGVS
ncbi:MAG TPA: MotA/TolQ/ExbB proton channel family protein [Candidatus Babeliaceae bacterium]|nr:MotA/TolQ/ExbB proton channel family protein [Candidatus Babeliaceae bacterium]